MLAKGKARSVLAVALTLTLLTLVLCQGSPALAQEGTGGAPPPKAAGAQPGPVAGAAPQAGPPVYNIFATDTFISLADGTVVYNYGFVGGRAGQPLTFQNSMKAAAPAIPGGNTTIATGAPNPTAGPVSAAEAPLLGNAQFPAPLIYASVGDVVQINFKNLGVSNKGSPNDPHSIHLHGLDVDAANDGVPETSVGAVPANLAVPGAGNVIVYMFTAAKAGTYMYHCHQEADIHVQMGMYGALVVYDPLDAAAAGGPGTGGGTLYGWKYDKDTVLLLSEMDLRQHASEQAGRIGGGAVYNPVTFQPQYWFINGLSFPNTVHAAGGPAAPFNWTNWIAAHPGYDPLIAGRVNFQSSAGDLGERVLIRMINMGYETQPMHMHGFHGKIIGSDQRAWPWANKPDSQLAAAYGFGLEKNTLTIGSGETYDWLINFGLQGLTSTYPPGTQSRANGLVPVPNTQTQFPPIPEPNQPKGGLLTYIGGPEVKGLVPAQAPALLPGLTVPSQFFPFHNHDDYKATNNGVYPGGMFTMIVPQ
jgi:manganese oxidase